MLGVNWPSIADLLSYLTAENTVEDNQLITFRDYHQAFKVAYYSFIRVQEVYTVNVQIKLIFLHQYSDNK